MRDRKFRVLICVCFGLSGMCALIYQLVWTRWLGLIVGNFATATATVITAFMGGLALGNWRLARLAAGRTPRAALRLYAGLEAGLAALAALSPILFSSSFPASALLAGLTGGWGGRAFVSLLALLPPTILMGGTLPAMVQALSAAAPRALGPLYALNTLGGALGPLLAAFILMPVLGLKATVWLAALLNAAVALTAWTLAGNLSDEAAEPAATPTPGAPPAPRDDDGAGASLSPALALWLAGASGFLSLGFEIALTREFVLTITGGSVYGFAVILSCYLLGLALGALLLRRLAPGGAAGALRAFATAQAIAWVFALTTPFWDQVPILLVRLWWNPLPFGLLMGLDFAVIMALLLVVTTAFGFALPALAAALPDRGSAAVGRLFAANTLGAVLGAPLTGFVLLRWFGLADTLLALGVLSGLVAIAAWVAARRPGNGAPQGIVAALPVVVAGAVLLRTFDLDPWLIVGLLGLLPGAAIAVVALRAGTAERVTITALIAAPACLLLPLILPRPDVSVMNAGMYNRPNGFRADGEGRGNTPIEAAHRLGKIIYEKDSVTARIAVRALSPLEMSFIVNGKPDGSTSLVDMYTQIFMAHLPALMNPRPRRVLVIGCGTGTTTGCLTLHPEVEEIHLAEIEPAQIEVARIFGRHNYNGVDSPKVHIHLDDARHFLLADRGVYDVIVSEPSNLWVSGMVNLFTREFYENVRRHLAPGGVFFQWIHYYRISDADTRGMMKTFTTVFPQTTFWVHQFGDAFLLARDPDVKVDVDAWTRRLAATELVEDLKRIQITPAEIFGFFLWGPEDVRRYCAAADICTDDRPFLEFTTPRVRYSPDDVQELRRRMQLFGPLDPMPLAKESAALRLKLGDQFFSRQSLLRAKTEYLRARALEPGNALARKKIAQVADLEAMFAKPAAPGLPAPAESFTR